MKEHQLYDKDGLFHNIVKQSSIMAGRYAVLPNGSVDLNAGNVITGVELPQEKYPLVACLPPTSELSPSFKKSQWEWFNIVLLFCCKDGVTGDGQLKDRDYTTNSSMHTAALDWNDMKQSALGFLSALETVLTKVRGQLIIDDKAPMRIRRFTRMQNDNISGVMLSLRAGVATDCEFTEYDVNAVELPAIIHQQHYQ